MTVLTLVFDCRARQAATDSYAGGDLGIGCLLQVNILPVYQFKVKAPQELSRKKCQLKGTRHIITK